MAVGVLEVACPACSVTQWMQVKSALQPHLSPAKCVKCGEPLASGDTAVLLGINANVRKMSKWVTFMGVVVMVGLIVNGIIFLGIAASL